jgi:hypothetical protein
MPSLSRVTLFLACLSAAGCAPQLWAKPGGTPLQFEQTKSFCTTQSYGMFPPVMQPLMVSPGYVMPLQTTCFGGGHAVNCFTTGGDYIPPTFVPVDQNQGARNSAVRSCLMATGWQPVKDAEEAARVTNSAPYPAPNPAVLPGWDAARAACQQEASAAGSSFQNAFDACMRARGL